MALITKHRTVIVAAISVLMILVVPVTLAIAYVLYVGGPDSTLGFSVYIAILVSPHYSPMIVLGMCAAIFGPRYVWGVLVTGHRTITTAAVTASTWFAIPALLTTIHFIHVNEALCFTNVCPLAYLAALLPLFVSGSYLAVPGICAVVFGPVKRRLGMGMGRAIRLAYSVIAIYYMIVVVWVAADPSIVSPSNFS